MIFPIVYIAHPVRGDVAGNLAEGRRFVKAAIEAGYAPVAPWITACEVLDDNEPAQRQVGMKATLAVVRGCDEIWLCGPRVSEGMQAELYEAEVRGLTVRRFVTVEDVREVTL